MLCENFSQLLVAISAGEFGVSKSLAVLQDNCYHYFKWYLLLTALQRVSCATRTLNDVMICCIAGFV